MCGTVPSHLDPSDIFNEYNDTDLIYFYSAQVVKNSHLFF